MAVIPMEKKPFDIALAVRRMRKAVQPWPKAALFELAENGFTTTFEQLVACIISIRTYDEVTLPVSRKLFERARTRNIVEQMHRSVGRPRGAGPVHPRVHVRRYLPTIIVHLDHLQCAEHGAAVIPVSMRKNDSVRSAHIESQAFNVSLEYCGIWPGVKQERLGVVATPRSDGAG